jgi:hypothetical protein
MARGFIRTYRTYSYIDKNPVIDKVRTLVQDEGLMKDLSAMHEISGVATATLRNWFFGDTRNPQHSTVAAIVTSLGYEEQFVKARDIDIAVERKAGHDWLAKRAKRTAKAKTNGHGRKK